MTDLVNQHTRGIDGYPDTTTAAFDMLVSYCHLTNCTAYMPKIEGKRSLKITTMMVTEVRTTPIAKTRAMEEGPDAAEDVDEDAPMDKEAAAVEAQRDAMAANNSNGYM